MLALKALLGQFGIKSSETRPWGSWVRYADPVCLKTLQIKAGQKLSLQRHLNRAELWVVLTGNPMVTLDGQARRLIPGELIWIGVEDTHRLEAIETPVQILELHFGVYDEADIQRLADDYGRAEKTT